MKFFPKKPSTLRSRLLLLFGLSILAVWAIASGIAWIEIRDEVDDILDEQQIAFARYLANSDLRAWRAADRSGGSIPAFAVFDIEGNVILNDGLYGLLDPRNQKAYPLSTAKPELQTLNRWRMLWLELPEERFGKPAVLAVGQSADYREETVFEAFEKQLLPWLILFPLSLAAVLWMTRREFQPLLEVSEALARRRPEDATPLKSDDLPGEIRPFVDALNALFARMSDTLLRERRFTSDASHELRSPLAGLRVQTEVARMSARDPDARERALANLTRGIDRTTRLVEQLLALSRLDSLIDAGRPEDGAAVDWNALTQAVLDDFTGTAARQGIDLQLDIISAPSAAKGNELLLSLLLRNLVDNALNHSPERGTVWIRLSGNVICVDDDGPGVRDEYLPRLGERFFRLPGGEKAGTGLGLSIVKRIAELHGFHIVFSNRPEGGFRACLYLTKLKEQEHMT